MSASLDRTKRKLLDGVVRENVAVIRNAPPPGLVTRRRRWGRPIAATLVVGALGALAALAGSAYLTARTEPTSETPTLTTASATTPDTASPAAAGSLPNSDAFGDLAAGVSALAANSTPAVEAELSANLGTETFAAPTGLDPAALQLRVRRIVLDPGHGGADLGTVAPGALTEKEVTLDVARKLRGLLRPAGFEVLLTRDADHKVSLQQRAEMANAAHADLFVSIHVNWYSEPHLRGVETFVLGASDDPYVNALAASENRDSGYSLADFRSLLDGIYADVRQEQSTGLATAVQRSLTRTLRRTNPTVRDRGVRAAPFLVLVATDAPAILAEVSCLSNDDEAKLLATSAYRQEIAEALASGIETYAASLVPVGPAAPAAANALAASPVAPGSGTLAAVDVEPNNVSLDNLRR